MFSIQRIEEFQISIQQQQAINALLKDAFDAYPDHRIYANQLPSFRLLVWDDSKLVGHMAVEFRMIRVGQTLTKVFGIADLCVDRSYQQQNIATSLLQELERLGKPAQVEFIVLIAPDHGVYEKNGFQLVNNPCRWLMINNHQTFGVGNRKLSDCLLIKQIGETKWSAGLVDLLGHIF